jgi:ABC-type multidrug transport system fused ATPase/permease subunit
MLILRIDLPCLCVEVESAQYKKTIGFIAGEMTTKQTMKQSSSLSKTFMAAMNMKTTGTPYDRARYNWRRLVFSPSFRQHVQMLKEREQNLVNTVTGSFVYGTVKNPLTITFNELNLHLKHNDAPILQDIFGCFRPFNITALMGSSGAGKVHYLPSTKDT